MLRLGLSHHPYYWFGLLLLIDSCGWLWLVGESEDSVLALIIAVEHLEGRISVEVKIGRAVR